VSFAYLDISVIVSKVKKKIAIMLNVAAGFLGTLPRLWLGFSTPVDEFFKFIA
jgi:hypothetical protein